MIESNVGVSPEIRESRPRALADTAEVLRRADVLWKPANGVWGRACANTSILLQAADVAACRGCCRAATWPRARGP